MASGAVSVTDTLRGTTTVIPRLRTPAAAIDTATLAASAQIRKSGRATARDAVRIAPSVAVGQRLTVALSSGLSLRGRASTGLYAKLAEHLAIGGRLTSQQRIVLRETVRLLGRQSSPATRRALMRAGLRISDTPRPRRGVALHDGLRLSPRPAAIYRAVRSVVDHLHLTASLGHQLLITAMVQEGMDLLDGTLLQGLYAGHLQERLDFILDVVHPGGDVTTWAMNVRTNAVTEYLNFGFNAFARAADGGYLAAGDDGLYVLDGEDDAGQPIIADVVSGLADFSGLMLSGIQAAYLGLRGKGEFFLRLTSDQGQSTTYAVRTTSMRTARVNMGKGWRARMFTWELLSTGQDFDLLDVTFLPIQGMRRI